MRTRRREFAALPGQKHDYTVTLTVMDDDPAGAVTAEATQTVTISMANHPPVSDPGGPYFGYVGTPVTLSGIGSYDPDQGTSDHIVSYGWQLTNVVPYQYADASNMAVNWTWNTPGTYNVGLQVTNRFGLSTIAWTTVQIGTGNPTKLFVRPDLEGEYGSPVDLMAQLTTPSGVPIADMPIDFYVDRNRDGSYDPLAEFAGEVATDATGWATLPYLQVLAPDDGNPYPIEARFAGRDLYFPSTSDNVLEMDAARTVLTYTGDTTGSTGQTVKLTATLTDYLGNVVAGVPVSFTLGSQARAPRRIPTARPAPPSC